MPRVIKSTIIDAPTDRVWEVLRDFNGHDQWHPAVATSAIERGQSSDKIGCVRRFKLADGSELREQLLALSDLEQSFSYCLLDTPIPMFNYVAHVRLLPSPTATAPSGTGNVASRRDPRKSSASPRWSARTFIRRASRPCASASWTPHEGRDCVMPVSVKTCASPAEAAAALASDRGARYIAGGTLVMRALERRRCRDHDAGAARRPLAFRNPLERRAQVTLGAEVTLLQILRNSELAFLHPVARTIGGPAVRTMGTVGGNLFAHPPFGDLTVALLALDATVSVQSGYGQRETPLEEFLANRDRAQGALVTGVSFARPASPTPSATARFRASNRRARPSSRSPCMSRT